MSGQMEGRRRKTRLKSSTTTTTTNEYRLTQQPATLPFTKPTRSTLSSRATTTTTLVTSLAPLPPSPSPSSSSSYSFPLSSSLSSMTSSLWSSSFSTLSSALTPTPPPPSSSSSINSSSQQSLFTSTYSPQCTKKKKQQSSSIFYKSFKSSSASSPSRRSSSLSSSLHNYHQHHHHHYHYLIIHTAVLFCLLTWLKCYAQDSTDFALRPFSASLHSTSTTTNTNTRRQDGAGGGGIPMAPIDIVGLSNNPAKRHSSNEPNLMPVLTAPVPRGSGSNPRPSFQRIRLNPSNIHNQAAALQPQPPPPPPPPHPQSIPIVTLQSAVVPRQNLYHPPQPQGPPPPPSSPFLLPEEYVPVALTESPLPNFQRLVGLSPPGRLPQSPALSSSVSFSGPAPSLPVVAAPQRQSFRRIKPPSNGNWRVKPKVPVPTMNPTVMAPVEPIRTPVAAPRPNNNARLVNSVPVANSAAAAAAAALVDNKLHGRGPISAQDEDLSHKPNALDNEDDPGIIDRDRSSFYGNRLSPTESAGEDNGILAIESLSRSSQGFEPVRTKAVAPTQSPSVVPTPTIPLTFYTTFTYYTTVVRGPHTAMLSREQVASSTQLKAIDRNIVTAIEFSNGYIQPNPTKMVLGTKTKGQTTTIYDVASRVQVFNDDLYKVIFATSSQTLPPPPTPSSSMVMSSSSVATRIAPSRAQASPILLESTKVMNRHTSAKPSTVKSSVTVRLEQLQNQLKKQLSLLTYYYTLIEGTRTQYSTRVEESSTNYNGDLGTLVPSIAPTIDSYGLLKIISPHSVVSLGSRANGQQTTVVNLALNNYIKFNRVKDAQIDIQPTSTLSSSAVQPSATRSSISSLSGSMESDPEDSPSSSSSTTTTPRLDGSSTIRLDSSSTTPTPALSSTPILASETTTPTSVSRSRGSSSRRPGVRVKVKPIRSKLVNHLSRHSSRSSSESESAATVPTPPPSSSVESLPLTPTIVDQTPVLSSMMMDNHIKIEPSESLTPTQRKKVAFTIRRPGGSSGVNRFFSRRPSSHLFHPHSSPAPDSSFTSSSIESTTTTIHESSGIGVQTSSVSQMIAPSSTVSSSSLSSSSIMETTIAETTNAYSPPSIVSMPTPSLNDFFSQLTSSSLKHHQQSLSPTPVWHTSPSKTSKNRLVVLTRLAGANNINKWNPMYNSRVRVSSRRLIKSTNPLMSASMMMIDSSMVMMEPSSAYETLIIETTTHTVPFTIGSSITYTTVEETNSRTISNTMDLMSSPTFEDLNKMMIEPTSVFPSDMTTTPTAMVGLDSHPAHSSSSYVIVETSDIMTTSTLYSTYTYFATLFNGTQTSITPLEEVKTEYLTLREPVVITRTIVPSVRFTNNNGHQSAIVPTRTRGMAADDMASTSIDSVESLDNDDMTRMITETYSTQTTLTHFITLFSGTHTILSSIEEISPTVMTRTRFITPYTLVTSSPSSSGDHHQASNVGSIQTITPSSTLQQQDMDTMATSSLATKQQPTNLMPSLYDMVQRETPTPSPPLTTPGSIAYETGPLDPNEIFMVDQMFEPNRTLTDGGTSTTTTSSMLEPGSVIELEDLLEGVQDAGPIGETIKDIVRDIYKDPGDADTTTQSPDEGGVYLASGTTTSGPPLADVAGGSTTVAPSFTTKATPSLNRYAIYSQKSSKQPSQQSSLQPLRDHQNVIFSTQSNDEDGGDRRPVMSTRYVTSVEKSIRTLTLTSTKVYYTRDSPLTITSVLTTTLAPITYVSTIIGSKTILGTYNSITPTKTMSTTEYGGGTRSTSSLILPSSSSSETSPSSSTTTTVNGGGSPTTRPRLHRPKPSGDVQHTTNKAKVASILNSGNNRGNNNNNKSGAGGGKPSSTTPTLVRNNNNQNNNVTTNTMTTMDPHLQLCEPACNTTNKEYCRESETNRYSCECRPGFVRRPSDGQCQEIKNYLVTVRVSKTAETEVAATSASDGELQKYARVARRQVGKADGIAGLQVLSVDHSARSKGALVNLTIQIDHQTNNVHDELSRKLEPLGRVERVVDFDECSAPIHNDCSPRARCLNEPGSYSCQCYEPFIDLDQSMPGRLCVTEIKSCDYCHSRGDCWRNNSDMVCRCHPMYIGRRCEINGLLLAILVPIVAILLIIAIICFFYCSRKLRQRNRRFKNLTAYGPVAVIGGTLDRKAMLETSSESSDPQHRSSHYTNESQPASVRGSMARRNNNHNHLNQSTLRRESEPSLDRSLASYTATAATAAAAAAAAHAAGSHYNSLPHQIVIPRARPTYTLHPGQVYMW